jgi:hypothetical protein
MEAQENDSEISTNTVKSSSTSLTIPMNSESEKAKKSFTYFFKDKIQKESSQKKTRKINPFFI